MSEKELTKRIQLAVKKGVVKALISHKAAGKVIYTLKEKRLIAVPADNIKIDKSFIK